MEDNFIELNGKLIYMDTLSAKDQLPIYKDYYKLTEEEYNALEDWLKDGNDFLDNPMGLSNEKGSLLNFIEAYRNYDLMVNAINESNYR